MGLKDFIEPEEEVEWSGAKVEYDDKSYHAYITNKRLIFHEERGFFSKSDDIVSWKLEKIKNVTYKNLGYSARILNLEMINDKTISFESGLNESVELLAKLRARIS